jgi:predicted Zn-dependent protease
LNEFSLVTRDELWVCGPKSTLLEQRIIHGTAAERDSEIIASDARDDELLALCQARADAVRSDVASIRDGRARVLTSARRVGPVTRIDVSLTVSIGRLSVVTTPATLAADYARLARAASLQATGDVNYRDVPIVWRGGAGAVLLHEAVGHPAEGGAHSASKPTWPKWLSVHDEPAVQFDDEGNRCMTVDLLAGERPGAFRRASFADVPLRRMTNLIVRQQGATFELPARRLEVDLITGGSFDPLTDTVTLQISAAELIEGKARRAVAPFTFSESRSSVSRSLVGAMGEPDRYPGVICSSEGQALVVGSFAPVLVTVFHG